MLLAIAISLIFTLNNGISAFAAEAKTPINEAKLFSKATIDEDFDDSSLLIVLKPSVSKYSGISKVFSDKLFANEQIVSVTDLTELPKNILNNDGSINLKNASETAAHFSKISYKQILRVTLAKADKQQVLVLIKTIEVFDEVLYVGPDYIDFEEITTPNDPRLSEQWAIVGANGTKTQSAWGITVGSRNVRVGVIDSGIASHNDLNANVVTGRDYYNNNNTTTDEIGGHGTSVAGIIGAVDNNNIGVSGIEKL